MSYKKLLEIAERKPIEIYHQVHLDNYYKIAYTLLSRGDSEYSDREFDKAVLDYYRFAK